MPFLFQYLLKFSLSLAVLYTFYYLILRPLTFYQWNRFYLLCYSLLSFVIPFINIMSWLPGNNPEGKYFINSIPDVENIATRSIKPLHDTSNKWLSLLTWNAAGVLFLAGAVLMLTRVIYQYISLRNIKSKAVLLETGDFELYDVDSNISPFSFANAIFINSRLHTEEEFHKILEHEFVHVKQKHTFDIVVAEIICIFNWFNPFAWLLRKATRQNLEFIADHNVLEGGIDLRQYQYLLLKVMGLPQYTITNNFSFSSLKNRITMMNKIKTTRVHLVKFLFILPLLVVMLFTFRDRINFTDDETSFTYSGMVLSTDDDKPQPGVVVKEVSSNVETVTDKDGVFQLALPFNAEKLAYSVSFYKEGILKMKTFGEATKSSLKSKLVVNLIGINNNSSDTTRFVDSYHNGESISVVDFSTAAQHEAIKKALSSYLQRKKDMKVVESSNRPVMFIRDKIFIMAGDADPNHPARNSGLATYWFDYPKDAPLIYLNGVPTTFEKLNATVDRTQIETLKCLNKEQALKKYGKSRGVVELTLYPDVEDTLPKRAGSPAVQKKSSTPKTQAAAAKTVLPGSKQTFLLSAKTEELLKKLPGVEIGRDGDVKVQGEQIKKIVVDGVGVSQGRKVL